MILSPRSLILSLYLMDPMLIYLYYSRSGWISFPFYFILVLHFFLRSLGHLVPISYILIPGRSCICFRSLALFYFHDHWRIFRPDFDISSSNMYTICHRNFVMTVTLSYPDDLKKSSCLPVKNFFTITYIHWMYLILSDFHVR